MKNIKVAIFKKPKKIPDHVTALISEQLSKLWLDNSSLAKLDKRILQKAEVDLEPRDDPISSRFLQFSARPGQSLNQVTALTSEQFSESWSDNLSLAKLGKRVLHKAKAVLCCIQWYCIVLHGILLQFRVLYYIVRYYKALQGTIWYLHRIVWYYW